MVDAEGGQGVEHGGVEALLADHVLLEELQRQAEPYRRLGLTVEVGCEWHAPLEEGIGHHVIRPRPDLVIKTTQRHPAAPRVALTRTDWALIRQVPAPLLLVGPRPWPVAPCVAAAVDAVHPPDAETPVEFAGALRSIRRRVKAVRAALLAVTFGLAAFFMHDIGFTPARGKRPGPEIKRILDLAAVETQALAAHAPHGGNNVSIVVYPSVGSLP